MHIKKESNILQIGGVFSEYDSMNREYNERAAVLFPSEDNLTSDLPILLLMT
jgi:hypothetical protein